jgi:HEAT repeat protein
VKLHTRSSWIIPTWFVLFALVFPGHAQEQRKPAEQWQVDGIKAALEDPLPSVRLLALDQLGSFSRLAGIPASQITPFLKDPSSDVRGVAASALGAMQAKDQAGEVVKLLKDPAPGVRRNAASALGAMQAKDQAGEVVKLLKDPDSDVRYAAASALGTMQAEDQMGEIDQLLKDPDPDVRTAAEFALGAMQAKKPRGEVVKLLRDSLFYIRLAAASALAAVQAKEETREMVEFLKNPDPFIRGDAVSALGRMHAKEQVGNVVKLLKDPESYVRTAAATALGNMQARDQAGEVVKLLKDPQPAVATAAASALGTMQAKDQAPELIDLLRDPDPNVRKAAASALRALAPLPRTILPALSEAYYVNHAEQDEVRFLSYYLTAGDPSVRLLLRRIMFETNQAGYQKPGRFLSVDEVRAALNAFHELLPSKPVDSGFAADANIQIAQIASEWRTQWSPSDRELLSSLGYPLGYETSGGRSATGKIPAPRKIIDTQVIPWWQTAFRWSWKFIAVQITFWILLLYFYPTSTRVQAFVWNRWARRFFGLGYVGLCLTWIPFLRNRLLAPFREELLADARVGDESLNEYFEDVQVQEGGKQARLSEAITEVKGQIVLEGESGLGKSMFLRRLVKNTKPPIAYLPAENCDHGVFELIQLKLKGRAGDQSFLKSIIRSGGLRIVIDGLTDVTEEARENIRQFLDDFPKAHVLLTIQPMLWKRPAKARVLRLLPLGDDRI